ncbi:hypothetical protein [Enterobacter roggenkampii]|uniref:hypothetical protein n=1 Tax=Enterobacter roggenkampii TaxID=1812935 RepID=UPI003F43D528
MKKILIILISMTHTIYAYSGTLSCGVEAYVAGNNQTNTQNNTHGNTEGLLTLHHAGGTNKKYGFASLTVNDTAAEVFKGANIKILYSTGIFGFRELASRPVTAGDYALSYELPCPNESTCSTYIIRVVLDTQTYQRTVVSSTPATIKAITSHSDYLEVTTTTFIRNATYITDSIDIPDNIDLGTLSVGYNTSPNPVDYKVNTNSIGLYFTQTPISGTGHRIAINDMMTTASQRYLPPFRFGLYLTQDNPGIYSTSVNARWTCP